MKSLVLILFDLAIGIGLWVAYTCHPSRWEWCIGAASAVFATLAVFSSGRVAEARFRPRLWMILQGWRIPGSTLTGTWQLLVSTYRQIFTSEGADSYLAAIPFEFGDSHNSRDSARRMLAVFYPTSTPNSIVLGPVCELNLLLYHQVLKVNGLQMIRRLSGKPS